MRGEFSLLFTAETLPADSIHAWWYRHIKLSKCVIEGLVTPLQRLAVKPGVAVPQSELPMV